MLFHSDLARSARIVRVQRAVDYEWAIVGKQESKHELSKVRRQWMMVSVCQCAWKGERTPAALWEAENVDLMLCF